MLAKSKTKDLLIEDYQIYALKLAKKLLKQYNLPAFLLEDMEAAAYLGLVEAADRFQANRDVKFSVYAFYRIRGAVLDFLRKNSHLSATAYKAVKTYQALDDLNYEQNNQIQTNDKHQKLSDLLSLAAQGALIYKLMHNTSSQEESCLSSDLNQHEKNNLLVYLVNKLSEKEKFVIVSHYFKDFSFTEIGEVMGGISKSWVSRIHSQALEKLHTGFIEHDE